jgi:hypothetical protein
MIWKFPISPAGRVDFSGLAGPADLSIDEAAAHLIDIIRDNPTVVIGPTVAPRRSSQ